MIETNMYRKHATNRAHLTFIFIFEVGITNFQYKYLNQINGSLNINVEK